METELTYYELRPGLDVFDSQGEHLGTIESVWRAAETGKCQEVEMVEGFGPCAHHDGMAARFRVEGDGYFNSS